MCVRLGRGGWVLLILVGLALSAACGIALVQTLAPAIQQSGVVTDLAEAAAIHARLIESGYAEQATVTFNHSGIGPDSKRSLKITAGWRGERMPDADAATLIAGVVLDTYPDVSQLDRVAITISEPTRVGPFTYGQGKTYAYSPAGWRSMVNAMRLPKPPALGALALADSLSAPGVAQQSTCPTKLNSRQFVSEGIRLSVTGRCADTASSAYVELVLNGLTFTDGELRVEVRGAAGMEWAAVGLWVRFASSPARAEGYNVVTSRTGRRPRPHHAGGTRSTPGGRWGGGRSRHVGGERTCRQC